MTVTYSVEHGSLYGYVKFTVRVKGVTHDFPEMSAANARTLAKHLLEAARTTPTRAQRDEELRLEKLAAIRKQPPAQPAPPIEPLSEKVIALNDYLRRVRASK